MDEHLNFDIDTKGDDWVDPASYINIFADDPEDTLNNLNDINNNTYFLKDKKADTTYVDDKLLTKADRTYIDSELTLKSDKTYVDTALLAKADKTAITDIDTKATNAATAADNAVGSVSQLKLSVEDPNTGLATKIDEDDFTNLLTEAMLGPDQDQSDAYGASNSIKGLIYQAISESSGQLAQAIQKNIEESQSGAVAEAINTKISESTTSGVVKTALDTKANDIEFKAIESKVSNSTTGLDSKAAKTDLDAYSTTTALDTKFDLKADKDVWVRL